MLPKRLVPGSRVGVVSPSDPVTPALEGQLETGTAFLRALGLEVTIGRNVRSASLGYTARPQEKAEDINSMFADPKIDAIICSQGGANANACLTLVDWEIIRRNPKVFLGISDITVLLNAIYARTGLVTFHGDDLLWGLGRSPTDYDKQEFISSLMEGQTGRIRANGPRKAIRSGRAEGFLVGGNLSCLLKLAGTQFFPNSERAILFLEGLSTTSRECDHMFWQLKQMGIFEKVRGVIIGHIDGLERTPNEPQMEEVLLRITSEFDFPILKVSDFGHNCPNTVLPIGANIRMDAGSMTMELSSAFVER